MKRFGNRTWTRRGKVLLLGNPTRRFFIFFSPNWISSSNMPGGNCLYCSSYQVSFYLPATTFNYVFSILIKIVFKFYWTAGTRFSWNIGASYVHDASKRKNFFITFPFLRRYHLWATYARNGCKNLWNESLNPTATTPKGTLGKVAASSVNRENFRQESLCDILQGHGFSPKKMFYEQNLRWIFQN